MNKKLFVLFFVLLPTSSFIYSIELSDELSDELSGELSGSEVSEKLTELVAQLDDISEDLADLMEEAAAEEIEMKENMANAEEAEKSKISADYLIEKNKDELEVIQKVKKLTLANDNLVAYKPLNAEEEKIKKDALERLDQKGKRAAELAASLQ